MMSMLMSVIMRVPMSVIVSVIMRVPMSMIVSMIMSVAVSMIVSVTMSVIVMLLFLQVGLSAPLACSVEHLHLRAMGVLMVIILTV